METEIEIAMDLGSANVVLIHNDQIIVNEPAIIAVDCKTNKTLALGGKARQMQGKVHNSIRAIRPFREGVITSFADSELLIQGLLKKALPDISPSAIKMMVSIPSCTTEVETHALRFVLEKIGINEVFMIKGPMAAALGIGIDVEKPKACMIVDVGGGITDIAVISLGGIVASKTLKIGGDSFTKDVIKQIKNQHGFTVSENTAELLKNNLGLCHSETSEGYNINNKLSVKPEEIALCVEKSISRIEDTIMELFEETPPELYRDLIESGIWLTGGGALLRGLDNRLSDKLGIKFRIVEDPLHAVVRGANLALRNLGKYSLLID